MEVDCQMIGSGVFEASGTGIIHDGMSLFSITTSACRFQRNPDRVDTDSLEALAVYFVSEGLIFVEQEGRSALLGAGGGVVCAANRPFVVECEAPRTTVALRLPRTLLPPRADLMRFTGHPLDLAGGAGAMVSSFALNLARHAHHMNRATLDRMMNILTDLLDVAFDSMAGKPKPHSGLVRERVKAYIRQHLHDPRLRPATISTELHLSPRYLHKLFADENTSLGRFLWEERVHRAARLVRQSAPDVVPITRIAFDCGFTNLSHFSRSFRQYFGLTPRDYRAQHAPA